ncbi:CD209 antigen-like protein E isoform X2 [Rhineura floridana]|uniref:CD209 antigen-like protein E isoform X2 n=1 Tax=Rhineura floridana TaxID=261503 RepID=UPI002AC82428|nr:CD209 antigen-like protein E isoform X2 [Rhineura floridana]
MTTPLGVYVLAQPSAPPLPPKPDTPSSFEDDDYDDAGVVTAMVSESQTTPSAPNEKRNMDNQKALHPRCGPWYSSINALPSDHVTNSSNCVPPDSDSPQKKSTRRFHVVVLYVLVTICCVMWAGLLFVILVKYSGISEELQALSEELQTLNFNQSEKLMRMRKDLDYVYTTQRILERTASNNFSELQDITTSICSSGKSSISHSCPTNWKTEGHNCYYISTEKKNWTDALWYCIIHRAHLVSIWSDKEQGFLRDNIDNTMTYWLGVVHIESEGKWRWREGDLIVSTAFWDVGEPQTDDEKNCGIMHPNGTWASAVCSLPYQWICKKKLIC